MEISSTTRSSLLLLSLAFARPILSDYTNANTSNLHDNSEDCNCYVLESGADSKTPSYFQHYRFFDFRDLASYPGQYINAPPAVNDTQDSGDESVWTPDIFSSEAWETDWSIQDWSKPASDDFPVRAVNSPANIYVGQNDDSNPFTWLTLRTSRLDDFQSVAEIENLQKNMLHASMRMYGRVVGASGAVAGFFTFFDKTNETDIEILTRDPKDKIRYTNQPALNDEGDEIAAASQAIGNLAPWDEWQTHRVDWLPGNSYWWLNGGQVAKTTYSVPSAPSYLVLNMWGDGGEWSGEMEVGESAEFQIQWIELVFNTSGPVEGAPDPEYEEYGKRSLVKRGGEEGCKVVCKVDGVKETGKPEVVSLARPGKPVSLLLLSIAFGAVSLCMVLL